LRSIFSWLKISIEREIIGKIKNGKAITGGKNSITQRILGVDQGEPYVINRNLYFSGNTQLANIWNQGKLQISSKLGVVQQLDEKSAVCLPRPKILEP